MQQERVGLDHVADYIKEKVGAGSWEPGREGVPSS
jgi:hypothetical protein